MLSKASQGQTLPLTAVCKAQVRGTPGQDVLLYVAEARDQPDKLLVHISPQQLQPQPAPNLVDQWKILSLQVSQDYPRAAPVLIFHYSSLDAGNFHKAGAPHCYKCHN